MAADEAANVVRTFRRFDVDGDGIIKQADLGEVLSKLDPEKWTEKAVKRLFRAIDANGDGCIQYEEFIDWTFGSRGSKWNESRVAFKRGSGYEIRQHATMCDDGLGKAKKSGRLLIFFDVDGVLNTEDEIPMEMELEDDEDLSPDAVSKAEAIAANSIGDHLGRWGLLLNRDCLQRLRLLLESFNEQPKNRCRLVLISSQRISGEQTEFIKIALAEIGISPKAFYGQSASLSQASRSEEILHYLAEQEAADREVAGWVAIDDDEENLEHLDSDNWVVTSPDTGLDEDAIAKVRASLVEQDSEWHSFRGLPSPQYDPGASLVARKPLRSKVK